MAEEGAVTVCVRVRPLISREQDLGDATQLHWKTEDRLISQIDGTKSFGFDRVFHSSETTEKVYEEIAVPIICSAIQGYNGTIFAYGQTASGKTYTMMGSADGLGVIPKAVNDIFKKIKEIPEREFLLRVSYMEIYNETITDLLCDTRKMKPLEIREDFNRNVYVADLTEEVVSTPDLALQWIKKGERNRHYGKTKMNQRSSRSHTIFRMILESREKGDPSNCDGAVMVSHLNLVDLAGSERASQTGAEGVRLKEGCNINRSLFILGQVIKKLSDGQAGGFINYRDSKLTRILQNSLGGNAKTLIICTITPASFDETLSTLQFASTAKYMKNTPHVNEVLDDEALLKRYRKEIIDLKKQLEEVSSETRVQAMEKDQLAQLLEEKDLLQKVQNDKIQNLTQMLVTSSSITLQQDLKAKRKRRVTWCPGKMNKMKDIGYVDDFAITKATVTKSIKATAIPSIVETDESICSEFDIFSNTLETISETDWNPATKLNQIQEQDLLDSVQLCETIISEKETVQNELNSLRANFDNLVLDYEQLQRKKAEMELKLNEKLELEEFMTLEMQTVKEQENELKSKSQLLKEKEEQIKELQKLLELQRVENIKMDSSSVDNGEKLYEELKHLKQSLLDTETIALDAKKETAILKSENQDLKEKMEQLSSRCKQLEKENHLYQSQLGERKDSSKRRQADLERELQSAFNEITKLTSIIDGKYSKDLRLAVELERKANNLQKDLDKEIEENAALQREINILSELKTLPTELEILRKERLKKSEELDLLMAEKDKLLAESVCKDNRLRELLDEIKRTKEELAAAQSNHKTMAQEYQNFKQYHREFEQNYFSVLEEIEKMKHQIVTLSGEAHEGVLDLDDLVGEPGMETLGQEKLVEVREELCKTQQKLEEQLNNGDSGLRTVEMNKLLLHEKLHEILGQPGTGEKDDLKQPEETVQREKDQLRKDSQDATNLAIKLNEEQNLEAPQNLVPLTDCEKDNELCQQQRQISSLIQEKNQLQQMLECVTAEKNQLKIDLEENIEMAIENQEELRNIGAALKKQQEAVIKERKKTEEKEEELLRAQERLADTEEKLNEKIQELQEKEKQILNVRKDVIKAQEKVNEMEVLKDQLKSKNSTLERVEMENLELTQKLQASLEQTSSITKEMNELKKTQMVLQVEKDQLKENIREVKTKGLEKEEELKIAQMYLKEHQEVIDRLKGCISEQAAQGLNNQEGLKKTSAELQEKIQELREKHEQLFNVRDEIIEGQEKMKEMEQLKEQMMAKDSTLERINLENQELTQKLQASLEETSVIEERDELTKTLIALQEKNHQLKQNIRELEAKDLKTQEELKIAHMHLKEQQEVIDKLKESASEKTIQVPETQEALEKANAELQKRIQELQDKKEPVFNLRKEDIEVQEKINEVEHLKEQLQSRDSTLERLEMENLELAQKLQASLEETTSVTEERNELTKTQEVLHVERDQMKETIRGLIAKDLEIQEKLKIAEMDLKKHQEIINKLKESVSEKTAQVSETQEAFEKSNAELLKRIQELQEKREVIEVQEKVNEVEYLKEKLQSKSSALERIEMENLELAQKLQASLEETISVNEERDGLARTQEALQIERDQLKETMRDLIAKDLETQEKLKLAEMDLKTHQEVIDKLKERISEKTAQVSETQEAFEKRTAELQKRIQELQEEKEPVFNIKEEVTETEEKANEVEYLKEQLQSKDSTLERIEMENLELTQKLQTSLEEVRSVAKERDELTRTQEDLQIERDQLKETMRGLVANDLKTQEKLKIAEMDLKKYQETIDKLKESNAELLKRIQELQEKEEQLFNVRKEVTVAQEKVNELSHLKEQLQSKDSTLERIEMENLELAQKLQASLEETTSVTEERNELTKMQEALHIERNQLKETIRDLIAKDLETQEELKIAQMCLKEHQETSDKLKECISEKEALEKTCIQLQEKIQELQAKQEQNFNIREKVMEAQEKMKEMEQLKEQLKSKDYTLEKINLENLELAQKLQASLEETTSVTEERDELTKMQEALHIERNQLKGTIRNLMTKDQETQDELKFAEMCLKEKQEKIDKLEECISEKTAQLSKSQDVLEKINAELLEKMQMITNKSKEDLLEKEAQIFHIQEDLEKTNNELQQKILKLQETEEMLLSMKKEMNETKQQRQSLCQLEELLKNTNHTLSVVESQKVDLTQKLDLSLSKMSTVIKERDALLETEKALQMEINQLKESLKKVGMVDQQLVNTEANTREDNKQHPIESLKEKYIKINEYLKKYTMMENHCGSLSRLSLDLKRAFESQNELQVKVQACLSQTPEETKAVGKLLTRNRKCNNDLHSSSTCILKKLEAVLKRVINIRREHHNAIHKFEMDLIEEAERQNNLFIKIPHLQQHSKELIGCKNLSQKLDLHIEQIFQDVSETQNDIQNMLNEFQQLLNAKKEIILFLEICLSTHLDVESLKKIQEENDKIVHVNNLYHNKIRTIINESSEFEDRSVTIYKEWELELRQMKDKNEEMTKKFQTIEATHLPLDDLDVITVGKNKKNDIKLRHTRQTTKEIQEIAFHEDKGNEHKKKEIDQMQKNLEVTKVLSNKPLQSQQPGVQSSQDIRTVSSKEMDDLKMKLVKLNMEKMNESKKFEEEIASKTAIIEHMEDIIRQLKENLRRAQQCNDISILEPPGTAQASHTPLTCGGGSGIVQSTKALILKADRVRLEREICKLKQQNEYLTNHQSQLSREVKKWKERALKKEAQELTRIHSPKSPKLTEITSRKRQCPSPLYKEQISQETLTTDSPKSWAFDVRSKSLPVTCRSNYFDNSGLGLLPEIAFSSTNDATKETQIPREENTGSLLDQWQTSSGKDAPDCRTQ
ncbi:centromere-associated protein E isoform X2 [Macrotis lagotis]|uniref:centromere-associated protein E isoform X2 n=1 Tax=Macrotis lagotis TaxID=92651 RepID=UPI003D6989E9